MMNHMMNTISGMGWAMGLLWLLNRSPRTIMAQVSAKR
jgi:hypothetical protein